MRRALYLTAFAGGLALCAFSPSANAASISITSQSFTGDVAQKGAAAPASSTGVYATGVTGSTSGELSPYASNSDYSTVGKNWAYDVISANSAGGGTATFNVGASTFSLLWGSPDTYNNITFYSGSGGTGSVISTTGASGNNYIGSDLACYGSTCTQTRFDLVTFTDTVGTIGSVVLGDLGTAAFEFGTIPSGGGNVDTTPLPAALPLFASGLGALGLLARRRKRKAQAA